MDINENKKKLIAQLICLILSMGLWFYVTNVENPLKTYELNKVPVELLNVDKLTESKLALSPNQNLYVTLKLEGTSQQLFGIDRNDFKVTVDLDEYALKKGEIKLFVNITDAPSNIAIKNKNGLDVKIHLEELIEKEVAVKSEISIAPEDNYHVSLPIIKPEVVKVYGAESLVDQIDCVVARGEEDNLTQNLSKEYKIIPIDKNGNNVVGVQLSRNWVEVAFEVSEGRNIPVIVDYVGTLKSNLQLKSIQAKRDFIGVTGPEELLESTTQIFTEQINLSNIEDSITIYAKLNIPEGLYLYDASDNVEVEIIVEKVTTKEITIPYTMIGENKDISIVPNDNNVVVKVSGFPAQLNDITVENLKAKLDVSKYITDGEFTERPTVTLVNIEGITIDSVSEVKLIVKKETSTSTNGETEETTENIE